MAINQNAKEGNGPNAYKKGNRSKSKRATDHLVAVNAQYTEKIEQWRTMAEARRTACKYTQEWAAKLYVNVMTYVNGCLKSFDPETGKYLQAITRAGLQLAAGVISRDLFNKLCSGEYDYRLIEYIELNRIDVDTIQEDEQGVKWYKDSQTRQVPLIAFSEVLQKALLYAEAEAEQSMHINGRITELSRLNVVHGWREEKAATTTNNTLVIGGEEEAKHILELLK